MTIIKYRINEDSKKNKIDYRKVKKAVRHFKSGSTTYTYKIKKGHVTPILLKQVASGKMFLHKFDCTKSSSSGNGMSTSSNHSEYYVCRDDKDVVTTFNASEIFTKNSFRKKSQTVFKDCPVLVQKRKEKTWEMIDIPKIIKYYNNECV